ncbi:hypothetical protein V6N12_027691 [Hibiscus sabdariffa]|uniref:Uncharacterized protein n=1 Tax=Hibiscus sabdariffa TaxID=183260 RepID=A0ABR2F3M0_9ROSI
MVGMMNKGWEMPVSRQRSKVPTLVQAVEAVTRQGLMWGALLAAAALDARESLVCCMAWAVQAHAACLFKIELKSLSFFVVFFFFLFLYYDSERA